MELTNKPQRAWVNQPSTLQPYHEWHGARVLAITDGAGMARVYFTSGTIISARVLANVISPGWPEVERRCVDCAPPALPFDANPCRDCFRDPNRPNWAPKP